MRVLIFCAMLSAAYAADCSNVTCVTPPPLTCPGDSVLIRGVVPEDMCCPTADRCACNPGCANNTCLTGYISVLQSNGTGTPGNCCSKYECRLDCSNVTCVTPPPLTCPGDSVLIRGVVPEGMCCPTADRCACNPGCANNTCLTGYISVLQSNGTGTPGNCCSKYECKLDCSNVTCVTPPPLTCPGDSVLIRGVVPEGMCCPTADRCACKPGCANNTCLTGYISLLESKGTGTPGTCCNKYKCEPGCYTQWFDRDDPSGMGDFETLKELRKYYPGKICPKPFIIQATTLSGVPAESTGQVIEMYDRVSGFACVNSQQKNGKLCLDYKVRFGCPCPWANMKPGRKSEERDEKSSEEKDSNEDD